MRTLPHLLLLSAILILSGGCKQTVPQETRLTSQQGIHKLEYNDRAMLVDLDVGFKSVPMPMDFDGDGDIDLLVSESGAYCEAGVFYFENVSGNVANPVFRYGIKVNSERFRLGYDGMCFEVSYVNGHVHVLTPDNVNDKLLMYADVPQNVFWKKLVMPVSAKESITTIKNIRNNTWKLIDFDGDAVHDLMCGISSRSGNALLFFKNIGTDERAQYDVPREIRTKDGAVLGYDDVALADFDNDGDLDYLGIGPYSHIMYYENEGTAVHYTFKPGRVLEYNGRPIQFDCHYGNSIKPKAVDLDKDGFVDIVAGDEDGKISLLHNTGKVIDGIPVFLPPQFLQQEAAFVDFGAITTPRIFDWDGDGRDDIVSGNGAGYIGFIKNVSGRELKWRKPELLEADDKIIRLIPPGANWGYVTIDVEYWDQDELPDILANNHNGNVVWFKNIGTRKNPKLAAPQAIEVEWEGNPQKPAWNPGTSRDKELLAPWRTCPFIMDFNEDGLNDLVMLDYQGYLAVYLRYEEHGKLYLKPPRRDFIYPDDKPVLLNQLKGSSSGRIKFTFADWDGDGQKDLVFSSKPGVDWMKNMGMKDGKMVLQYIGRIISRTLMGHTDGPVVCDFNKDGIPDLLVGTETGVFYYWQRTSKQITTTMTTTGKQTPAKYDYFKR